MMQVLAQNSVPLCLCGDETMSRILIIEDETPMRTALKDVLEAEGYRVLTAADGESGLQRGSTKSPT